MESAGDERPLDLMGRTVGRYEVIAPIGRGATGTVYEAVDSSTGHRMALKILRAVDDPEAVLRFEKEAALAAELVHPHLVRVHEAGQGDGFRYLAMDLVEGQPLSAMLDEIDWRRGAEIATRVASGIGAAHALGIVHRDLKPGNVLMTAEGRPIVTDFGLAKRAGEDRDITRDSEAVGTPEYMSPEQFTGPARSVDATTDVWALGVLLYEVLTRRRPFAEDRPARLLQRMLDGDFAPPSSIVPSIPTALDDICRRCLDPDRRRRYADARALADALEAWRRGADRPGCLSWFRGAGRGGRPPSGSGSTEGN